MIARNEPELPHRPSVTRARVYYLGPGVRPPSRCFLVSVSGDPERPGGIVGDVLEIPAGMVACVAFVPEGDAPALLVGEAP